MTKQITEKQEIRIKKALIDFINKEIVIAPNLGMTVEMGDIAVADRKYQLAELLFGLFVEFKKYTDPEKLSTPDSLTDK